MPQAELIYDIGCPNIEDARRRLKTALTQAGESAQWVEWDRSKAESPVYARRYGSPTILINGRDVAGVPPSDEANCCRLYWDDNRRVAGVPSVDAIVAALGSGNGATGIRTSSGWRTWAPVIPAIGVSLLPKLACPACWPAYAGLLSALGVGFLVDATFLLPLTVLFLIAAVAALGWRAKGRRGYGPLAIGLLAAIVVVTGKFTFDSDPAMYGGIALLAGASLWNAWPKRSTLSSCPACESAGHLHQIENPNRRCSNG